MTRRRLTPEEIDLWQRVAIQAERLHPKTQTTPARPLPKPKPDKQPIPRAAPGLTKPAAARLLTPKPTDTRPPAVQMDRKAFGRMKRGKLVPEGRIDLHGMTLDRAHPALTRFVLTSQTAGRRLILVITGKGKKDADHGMIPVQRGILRRNVPLWLAMPPLAQAVLQVTPAHISHGGDGAFYVYLRRLR
ncbi:Smr/MutS family protein [Sedimentitalea sp. HM32M-2]|uniref:Smr/MutS family protein n=1 Tax=Sedimentitalea sp. HM32M-2 TaxID=3351566 RepID=UPI003634FFB4